MSLCDCGALCPAGWDCCLGCLGRRRLEHRTLTLKDMEAAAAPPREPWIWTTFAAPLSVYRWLVAGLPVTRHEAAGGSVLCHHGIQLVIDETLPDGEGEFRSRDGRTMRVILEDLPC